MDWVFAYYFVYHMVLWLQSTRRHSYALTTGLQRTSVEKRDHDKLKNSRKIIYISIVKCSKKKTAHDCSCGLFFFKGPENL